jgi:hypothetical protein
MQDFKTDAASKKWDLLALHKGAAAETKGTLARGAKDAIATVLPEVAVINEKLAPLLDLKGQAEKGARKIPQKHETCYEQLLLHQ